MHCYTRPAQIKNRCIAGGVARSVIRDFRMGRVSRPVTMSGLRQLTKCAVSVPNQCIGRQSARRQEGELVALDESVQYDFPPHMRPVEGRSRTGLKSPGRYTTYIVKRNESRHKRRQSCDLEDALHRDSRGVYGVDRAPSVLPAAKRCQNKALRPEYPG